VFFLFSRTSDGIPGPSPIAEFLHTSIFFAVFPRPYAPVAPDSIVPVPPSRLWKAHQSLWLTWFPISKPSANMYPRFFTFLQDASALLILPLLTSARPALSCLIPPARRFCFDRRSAGGGAVCSWTLTRGDAYSPQLRDVLPRFPFLDNLFHPFLYLTAGLLISSSDALTPLGVSDGLQVFPIWFLVFH